MAANDPKLKKVSGSELVTVSDWNVCFNSGDDVIALSCKVTTNDSSSTISGVGLILNNAKGRSSAPPTQNCPAALTLLNQLSTCLPTA